MSTSHRRIFGLCLCFILSFPILKAQSTTEYETVFAALTALRVDPDKVAEVKNFTLRRDAATFTFQEGRFYLSTPLGSRRCALLFVGKGHFLLTPPPPAEQEQLERVFEKKALQEEFSSLFIFTGDSLLADLVPYSPQKVRSDVEDLFTKSLKRLYDKKYTYAPTGIMKTLLDDRPNRLFYANVETEDHGSLIFEIDPFQEEEVRLSRSQSIAFLRSGFVSEIITQFNAAGERILDATQRAEKVHGFKILLTTLDSRIEKSFRILDEYFKFTGKTTVKLQSAAGDQRWVWMFINEKLRVDSVSWDGVKKGKFFQGDENPFIWLECDPPLNKDEIRSVTISYHGDVLRKAGGRLDLETSKEWYPRQIGWARTHYDATFHYPDDYKLACVGELQDETTAGDVTTTRWKTAFPVKSFSFNIGMFEQEEVREDSLPLINVLSTGAADELISKDVKEDMIAAIEFFQRLFGPSPVQTLHATEIPYFHGEAFPGLIHLSSSTFLRDFLSTEGGEESFRAHEVAHQWWGIAVDYRSYHDQWLSEAFSEYSGLMYMHAVRKNTKEFFKTLNRYKKMIINAKEGKPKVGPIALGYRAETDETQGAYVLQIYYKGAWVLHMLRNMVLDLRTMREDEFNAILKTFYSRYKQKSVTTEDFRKVVEERMKTDMGWFFKQWVYGTAIPKYTFSYRVDPAPDGKFRVRCRILQEDVPVDFQMQIPLRIDFGENRFARVRIFINGPVSEFDLPVMPMKPEAIVFNDLESVLCEVVEKDW